jgi:hypothetical protein
MMQKHTARSDRIRCWLPRYLPAFFAFFADSIAAAATGSAR